MSNTDTEAVRRLFGGKVLPEDPERLNELLQTAHTQRVLNEKDMICCMEKLGQYTNNPCKNEKWCRILSDLVTRSKNITLMEGAIADKMAQVVAQATSNYYSHKPSTSFRSNAPSNNQSYLGPDDVVSSCDETDLRNPGELAKSLNNKAHTPALNTSSLTRRNSFAK